MSARPSLYEVLGVPPKAPTAQVEKAYRRALELYAEGSLATYSIMDPVEQGAQRDRVQEAYDVLKDPSRRARYDASLRDGTPAPPPPSRQGPATARAVLPEPVTGAALREAREAAGVTLQQIAAASKVGVRVLDAIETERLPLLPVPVYLRGFVQEYARAIGLEPKPTAESYLARLRNLQA